MHFQYYTNFFKCMYSLELHSHRCLWEQWNKCMVNITHMQTLWIQYSSMCVVLVITVRYTECSVDQLIWTTKGMSSNRRQISVKTNEPGLELAFVSCQMLVCQTLWNTWQRGACCSSRESVQAGLKLRLLKSVPTEKCHSLQPWYQRNLNFLLLFS